MRQVTRRRFLAATGGALASSAASSLARGAAGRPPLNVLVLMTDQHHFGALGCMGNPVVKTPHLDRLAAEGVRFAAAACPVPYCSPTRAAILTGRYPSTMGIYRNIKGGDDPLRLREPMQTYLHRLAARGYACHHIGKWHLGRQRDLACFQDGKADERRPRDLLNERRQAAGDAIFDAGPRPGEHLVGETFLTANTARAHAVWKADPRRTRQDLSIIGRSRIRPEFHYETALADDCIGLLRRHRGEPFAVTCSVSPPHAFWVAPAPYYDLYDPAAIPLPATWTHRPARWAGTQASRLARLLGEEGVREYLRCYYAQVSMMDACFGRILDELGRLGLADRTLVVFASDHGDMQAGHGMMDKTVNAFYEEILRVPLLARLPGVLPKGRAVEAPCSLVDLAPTILDLLGAPPLDAAHGRSLRPLIEGTGDGDRPVFAERGNPKTAGCVRMVRTREWKLWIDGSGARDLYHLAADPGETVNLASEAACAGALGRLAGLLRHHMERIGDPALAAIFGTS